MSCALSKVRIQEPVLTQTKDSLISKPAMRRKCTRTSFK